MSGPAALLILVAHLALLSSISFGGFPTVLPDVRQLVVDTHGWMTNQEFANFFATSQALPGPNMILMMSFVGWKVWGFPGAARGCWRHLRAALRDLLRRVSALAPLPPCRLAIYCATRSRARSYRPRHCQRPRDGAGRRCGLASSGCDGRRGRADVATRVNPLWLLFAGGALGGLGLL